MKSSRTMIEAGPSGGEHRARVRVPFYLRKAVAVAVAVISRDGLLLDANRGFEALLPGDALQSGPRDVRDVFVNPRFDTLAARRCDPADGAVVRGILNLGGAGGRDGAVQSFHGAVYRVEGGLMLVAEHDVEGLQALNEKLLELNAALTARGRGFGQVEPGHGLSLEDRLAGKPARFDAGACLLEQGAKLDTIYKVTDGWVALYRVTEDGERRVLDFALPGDFIGLNEALDGARASGATCCTPTAAVVYDRAAFDALVSANTDGCAELARLASRSAMRTLDRLTRTAAGSARERILALLMDLFHRASGRLPGEDGESIAFPVSQTMISETLALRDETVSRALKALREEGILRIAAGSLTVLDHRRFCALAAPS